MAPCCSSLSRGIPKQGQKSQICAGFSHLCLCSLGDTHRAGNGIPILPFPPGCVFECKQPGGTGRHRAPGAVRGTFPFPICTSQGGDTFPPVGLVWESSPRTEALPAFKPLPTSTSPRGAGVLCGTVTPEAAGGSFILQ